MRAIKEKVDSYENKCPYGKYTTVRNNTINRNGYRRFARRKIYINIGDNNCKECLYYKGKIKNKNIHLCENEEVDRYYTFILIEKRNISE